MSNVTPRDPYRRAGFCAFAVIALLLIMLPYACSVSQAHAFDYDAERRTITFTEEENAKCIAEQGCVIVSRSFLVTILERAKAAHEAAVAAQAQAAREAEQRLEAEQRSCQPAPGRTGRREMVGAFEWRER